jgi:methionine synthase / methylenetetrahydrofolate reductase (NADH)
MADSRFLEELGQRVLLGSGAMGTEFLRRGWLPERPLDELNLSRPHLVADLCREYVEAGAEVIKTNTFLANAVHLGEAGLHDQVREINLAGAQLAREAARGAFVAGCVGPTGVVPGLDLMEVYEEQCRALAEGGCDLLLLETFTTDADLAHAYFAARATGLPVVCQMAVENGRLMTRFASAMGEPRADVVGVNCVSIPAALAALKEIGELTALPRSAFPDGGVSGAPVSPEDFGEGLRLLVDAGARLVGGCCGTGPDHIRAAAKVVGRGR